MVEAFFTSLHWMDRISILHCLVTFVLLSVRVVLGLRRSAGASDDDSICLLAHAADDQLDGSYSNDREDSGKRQLPQYLIPSPRVARHQLLAHGDVITEHRSPKRELPRFSRSLTVSPQSGSHHADDAAGGRGPRRRLPNDLRRRHGGAVVRDQAGAVRGFPQLHDHAAGGDLLRPAQGSGVQREQVRVRHAPQQGGASGARGRAGAGAGARQALRRHRRRLGLRQVHSCWRCRGVFSFVHRHHPCCFFYRQRRLHAASSRLGGTVHGGRLHRLVDRHHNGVGYGGVSSALLATPDHAVSLLLGSELCTTNFFCTIPSLPS
jgi:hypothetical protein